MSTEKLKIAKQSAMSELSYVSYLNFFLFEMRFLWLVTSRRCPSPKTPYTGTLIKITKIKLN